MKTSALTPGTVYRVRTAHSGTVPAVALEAGIRVAFEPVGSLAGRSIRYARRDVARIDGYRMRIHHQMTGVPMLITSWAMLGEVTDGHLRDLDRASAVLLLGDELPEPFTGGEARRLIDAAMVDERRARLTAAGLVSPRNIVEEWPRGGAAVDLDATEGAR